MNYTLGLVHAPIWEGQKKPGVAFGPSTMEEFGLNQFLFELGANFKVFKKPENNEFFYGQPEQLEQKYKDVFDLVDRAFWDTLLPVTLGGDHSLAMASVSAVLKHYPKVGILWVDAHADINTFDTSPSGNLHGMPVAALSGIIPREDMFKGEWMRSNLDLGQIVYIGLRDVDDGEYQILKDNNVLYYTAEQVHNGDLETIIKEAQAHFIKNGFTDGLHLSFDIDALSSELVPATGTPVENGLNFKQLEQLLFLIKTYFKLTSVDCVEFNPEKISDEKEILKTYSAIQTFFRCLLADPSPMVNRHLLEKV